MTAPAKTRIRVVTSRGHQYAQEVRYEWDRERKRGVTRVLRTLGPLSPLRERDISRLSPDEIVSLIHEQEEGKRQARLRTRTKPDSTENDHMSADVTGPERTVAHQREMNRSSGNPAHSLTGTKGLNLFDHSILDLVRTIGPNATRRSVLDAARRQGIERPNHHLSLRRHVSFSLTRLFKAAKVVRHGGGGPGALYSYSVT